jgi:DNA-binding MarR family transcriptional regulator
VKAFTDELVRICRHFGSFEREMVCCGTVTVPQCLVLQQLRSGATDISSLAAHAGSSLSAMTRLVDGLERNGWTERTRDAEDRRRVLVTLTAAGSAEADRLYRATDAVIAQLFERIPKKKQAQVVESIRLLREAMDGASDAIRGCCGGG